MGQGTTLEAAGISSQMGESHGSGESAFIAATLEQWVFRKGAVALATVLEQGWPSESVQHVKINGQTAEFLPASSLDWC